MPREGVFAEVIKEGIIRLGDVMRVEAPDENRPFTAAVIVLSDKGSRGEREDASGPAAEELLKEAGYDVLERFVICMDFMRMYSAIPGAFRSATASVASGVWSRMENPVPPLVITRST